MKDRPDVFQSNPHPGATAFGDLCAYSDEKGFNVSPGDIGTFRLLEDGFQCFAVFAIHNKIISYIDTICKVYPCARLPV